MPTSLSKQPSIENRPSSSFSEDLVQGWLTGGDVAASVDQWIFWNNSPSRHVPLTTLTKFFPEKFFQILDQDPFFRAQVDAILRSKLSWDDPVTWMPQDPLWEIALIAPLRLQRLAFLASALSMKETLAKIIDGAVVRTLRQEIGEDVLEFVLLSGSLSKYAFAGLIEETLLVDDPVATLKQRALLFLENAFSAKEIGVQQRIASKVPGSFTTGTLQIASPLAKKTEDLFCKLWKEAGVWL